MFRQVILSTTKSKIPPPSCYSSMVHKDGPSAKSYLDETEVLVDKDSWKPKKSLCRSISLEHISDESAPKWRDVILSLKPRPQSAKVTFSREGINRPAPETAIMVTNVDSGHAQDNGYVSIQIEQLKDGQEVPRSPEVQKRLHQLAEAFEQRSLSVKKKILEPLRRTPTPPRKVSEADNLNFKDEDWILDNRKRKRPLKDQISDDCHGALDPQGYVYISWLFLVCLGFLYNAWSIFLRSVFPYQTSENLTGFLIVDYFFDTVYLIDIILFKTRIRFIQNGQLVEDLRLTRIHYMNSLSFKFDVLSLAPTDLFYLAFGPNSLLRFPRVLKIAAFWEFFDRIDAGAKSPYIIRILRTLIYMMFLVHLNACAYYAMSVWEGLGSNDWVYNDEGNAYLRCFYFAIRTATSISGKMPKPNNSYEHVFMTISWLMGVFVFAFLIGQIRDIVATATQNKTMYRHIMDQSIRYMSNLNLPEELQRKIRLWLNFTWEQQKTFDENKILNLLPSKMKTDLALSVHYHMLKKVELFKECERTVIRDLVVKLKPVLFLPGDYVCRKGEVGQEMYIVSKGKVCVTEGQTVLVTLSEGSVFGEISVLGIPGCSRRNADVRSLGYANLFVLSKLDLWDTLRSYPEAQAILKQKARQVMAERYRKDHPGSVDSEIEMIINGEGRPETPKMVRTVLQILPHDSKYLQRMSRSPSVSSAVSRQSQISRECSSIGLSSLTSRFPVSEPSTLQAEDAAVIQLDEQDVHNHIITDIIDACNSVTKSA
ncbi:Cyclic nucleotide-gated cation channel beta-1 [Halotydeus destructor]|nr:Cyclic nucleotide-gated cation channel beta-1 [Halotydeus destructor]